MEHFRAYYLRFLEFNLHLMSILVISTTIHPIISCTSMTRIIMVIKFLASITRIHQHTYLHLQYLRTTCLHLNNPILLQNLIRNLLEIVFLSRRDSSFPKQDLFMPLRPFVLSNLNRMTVNLVIQKSIIILCVNF